MKKLLFIFLISFFSCINFLQANIFEAIQTRNIEWVKSCINSGEKNSSYNLGMTPLHVAVINNFYNAVVVLVEADVDIDARDKEGCTPLYYAVKNGNDIIANYLIDKNAFSSPRDEAGETPLYIATLNEFKPLCLLLLKEGANPDDRSSGGSTPREIASPRIKEMFEAEDAKHKRSKSE